MGRTVLINGGSHGIGAALVRVFRREGYEVAFTYLHREDEAGLLARETGAFAIRADSGKRSEVFRAVRDAEKQFGTIDILVNNAGISRIGLCQDLGESEWNELVAVNQSGPFWYCQAVLPGMISRKWGRIINITSMWGVVGASCEVAYSMTKAALIGLTHALAKEVGPSGIRVNAIAPGVIDTEMNAHLSKEELAQLAEETPVGRIGRPEEVAETALFFAKEQGDFITGQVIVQDGGFSG